MITVTLTIYKFSELSDTAKERAREDWRNSLYEYAWGYESRRAIQVFCDHFDVTLIDWRVGPHEPFTYKHNATNKHFRGRKLRDFRRDYTPTGYCLDCTLWSVFYDVFEQTGDAKRAFDGALNAGFTDWRANMEYQQSDEYIDEELTAKDYDFLEDGQRWDR